MKPGLEIRLLTPDLENPLGEFFRAIREAGCEAVFHPHPLTDEEAAVKAAYTGKDLYYAALEGECVVGYGMLRGWDEGYEVPSLGIAMRPDVRGAGLGRLLMDFLHAAALERGAKKIRLTVEESNTAAVSLYRKMGYVLENDRPGHLVGFCDLAPRK